MNVPENGDALRADLLFGAQAIGDYLGLDRDRVYYAASTGTLPIGRMGAQLIASKRELSRHFEKLTRGGGGCSP